MIEISVFKSSQDWVNNQDCVLRHRFPYGSVSVPWDSLLNTFKFLYGSQCIVTFVCM